MLSENALNLILEYEVGGGRNYYNSKLKRPCCPGGDSGITIGIGYDLGYVDSPEEFDQDWRLLNETDRNRLRACIGYKAYAARMYVGKVSDIIIPWELALSVFQDSTAAKEEAKTLAAFPGADKLPTDAYGALVSLIYNRGPAMSGERRREMRAIRDAVPSGNLTIIAAQLRAMKRLWIGQGLDGLLKRREAEARLVENAK